MTPAPRVAHEATRREFLGTAGALAVAGVVGAAPEAAKSAAFQPIAIPAWVHDVTRMAFLTPGEVPARARRGSRSSTQTWSGLTSPCIATAAA